MMRMVLLAGILASLLAPTQAEDTAAKERKKLVGTWKGFAVEGRGETPDRGPVKLSLVITSERIQGFRNGKEDLGEGSFTIDPTANPKVLDATRTRRPMKGKTHKGIYILEGDTLKWCVAQPRRPRPRDFFTRRGQFLLILKRQKSNSE